MAARPADFIHLCADKIYESECDSRCWVWIQRAKERQSHRSQPASGLLLCQVPLRCNYDKVKWLVFITRPALIHNECDMMAAGIPRIPRRWKIAHTVTFSPPTCMCVPKDALRSCLRTRSSILRSSKPASDLKREHAKWFKREMRVETFCDFSQLHFNSIISYFRITKKLAFNLILIYYLKQFIILLTLRKSPKKLNFIK
jgi:hypothetical protein